MPAHEEKPRPHVKGPAHPDRSPPKADGEIVVKEALVHRHPLGGANDPVMDYPKSGDQRVTVYNDGANDYIEARAYWEPPTSMQMNNPQIWAEVNPPYCISRGPDIGGVNYGGNPTQGTLDGGWYWKWSEVLSGAIDSNGNKGTIPHDADGTDDWSCLVIWVQTDIAGQPWDPMTTAFTGQDPPP
jgi:hypothetical protein